MNPCCPIANRPDIREIDVALARDEVSYRKVRADANARSAALGVPPIGDDSAMRRHRAHVFSRMTGTDPARGDDEAQPGAVQSPPSAETFPAPTARPCCVVA